MFIVFVVVSPEEKLVIPPPSQIEYQRLQKFLSGWGVETKPKEYLPGDLNRDRIVNFKDFRILANNWLQIDWEFIAERWLEE